MYRVVPAALFATAFVLGACSSSPSPFQSQPDRPGADRTVPAANQLPLSHSRGGYDGAAAPDDDSRGARVGSVISHEGRQQAQKDQEDKERIERDALAQKKQEELKQQRAAGAAQTKAEPVATQ